MLNVRLACDHLFGKLLFTWLSLVMSMMVSFVLSFFSRDVLDEILNLIESVSEDFPSYSDTSENEHSQPTSSASPRFLVIHSQEERSVSSLSPFVIEKVLNGMAGEPRSIKNFVQVTSSWNTQIKSR